MPPFSLRSSLGNIKFLCRDISTHPQVKKSLKAERRRASVLHPIEIPPMAFPSSSRTATTSVAGKNNPLSASSSTTLVSPPPMSIDIIGDIPPVADADDADEFRDLLKTMGDSVRSVREFSQGLIERCATIST